MRGHNSSRHQPSKFTENSGGGGNQNQSSLRRGSQCNQQPLVPITTNISSYRMEVSQPKPNPNQSDFSAILECPVCFMIPDCEIFNCANGHSVCGNCLKRLIKCALCSAPFKGSRNFVVESLLAHFKKFGLSFDGSKSASDQVNCVGCKTSVANSELDKHENSCKYRPVLCKASCERCHRYLQLSEYFEHLLQYHNIKGLNEPSGVFAKVDRLFMGMEINSSWVPFYLKFDGHTFLRFASIRDRKFSWWIELIGSENECKKYRAVISLQCPKKSETRISWSVPVFSIRCSKDFIEANTIATLSSTQLLPFCSLNEPHENRVATHTWFCNITLSRVDSCM